MYILSEFIGTERWSSSSFVNVLLLVMGFCCLKNRKRILLEQNCIKLDWMFFLPVKSQKCLICSEDQLLFFCLWNYIFPELICIQDRLPRACDFAASTFRWPSCQFWLPCQTMRNGCSYRESNYFKPSSQKSAALADNTDRWSECTAKEGGLQNLPHSQYTVWAGIHTYTYFMEICQFLQHFNKENIHGHSSVDSSGRRNSNWSLV